MSTAPHPLTTTASGSDVRVRFCPSPTGLPHVGMVRTAEAAGMTLVALVRGDEFDIFTHPERVVPGVSQHVA